MTFWQDARPLAPRPSVRRRSRARGRRAGRMLVVAVVVLAALGLSLGTFDAAGSVAHRARTPTIDRTAHHRGVAVRWTTSLPDFPREVLADVGALFVLGDGHVTALAPEDGRVRWQVAPGWLAWSGGLRGDTLMVALEDGFVALDRATGAQRWRADAPGQAAAATLVAPPDGPPIAVVTTLDGGVAGLDDRTGETRWSARVPGRPTQVLAADDSSGSVALVSQHPETLRVLDARTGALRWEQALAPWVGAPVVGAGLVIVGAGEDARHGTIHAYDLASGAPRWQTAMDGAFQPDLQPAVDGEDLFALDQYGDVTRIDVATGTLRWQTHLARQEVIARPTPMGDVVLVPAEPDEVVTLDRATGAIRARRRAAGVPMRLTAVSELVVLTQRLAPGREVEAYSARALRAPARSGR